MDVHELDPPRPDGSEALSSVFRAALERGSPVDAEATLAGVRSRAVRRHRHRRRLARAGAVVALAVTAAVVVPTVDARWRMTQMSTLTVGRAPSATATALPAPVPTEGLTAAPLTLENVLRPQDVTAFGARTLDADPSLPLVPSVVGGVCIDDVFPVNQPSSSAMVTMTESHDATTASTETTRYPVGLTETIWRWDDDEEPQQVLSILRSQVADCATRNVEGFGPVQQVDASALTPKGGSALALVASGSSGPDVQLVLVQGSTVVVLHSTGFADDSPQHVVHSLVRTARVAMDRAVAGQIDGTKGP